MQKKNQKSIDITVDAYLALARLAEDEEGRTGRFVALKRLASRLILERAGMLPDEPR